MRLLAACAALAVCAAPAAANAANVLGNSGFEAALNARQQGLGTGDLVNTSYGNWLPWAAVNNTNPQLPAKVAWPHTGDGGGEFQTSTTADGGNNTFLLQDLPESFAPNQGYAIDAWIYPKAGTTEITIYFGWDRDSGRQTDATQIVVSPTTTTWSAFGAAGRVAPLTQNTWHEVRLVGHGGPYIVELLVDGARADTAFGTRANPLGSNPYGASLPNQTLVIGNTDGRGSSLNGAVVDDVSVEQLTPDPPPPPAGPETTIDSVAATSPYQRTFSFSSSDASASFECRLDAAPFAPCTSPYAVSELSAGAHTFDVRAINVAGQADPTPATSSFTVTSRQSGPAFTVNTSDDHDDGLCTDTDCSLREAINAANAHIGSAAISFAIPLPAPVVIRPQTPLPDITNVTVLDGTTQPGALGPGIVLDGGFGDGLVLRAHDSRIRGFVVQHFSGIGIHVYGANDTVDRNWVGLDSTGTRPAGNSGDGIRFESTTGGLAEQNIVGGNGGHGIFLFATTRSTVRGNKSGNNGTVAIANSLDGIAVDGGSGNTIGGRGKGDPNVVSGNNSQGISLFGVSTPSTSGNTVLGNFVGTGAGGDGRLPNAGDGIRMFNAFDNVIGGPGSAANTIVGNGAAGVAVYNAVSTGNQIIGNSIHDNAGLGIDLGGDGVTSTEAVGAAGPNHLQNFPASIGSAQLTRSGATLDTGLVHHWTFDESEGSTVVDSVGSANGTIVGSASRVAGIKGSGAVETISSTDGYIEFPGSTLALGTSDLTVSFWVRPETDNSSFTDYFGNRTEDSHGNYVSIRGNFGADVVPHYSIEIDDGGPNYVAVETQAHRADGQWHLLSVTRQGTSVKVFWDGAVDGTAVSPGIANLVEGGKTARLGRHLAAFGFISPHAGFDDLRIYGRALSADEVAQLASAAGQAPQQLLIGANLRSAPAQRYRIDVYANTACDQPSLHGEGATWLGSLDATTNAAGAAAINGAVAAPPAGTFVTLTATNTLTKDTSEFSPCALVTASGRATDEGTSLTLSTDTASSAPGATAVGLDNLSLASVTPPSGSLGSAPVAAVDMRSLPVAAVPVAAVPVAAVNIGLSGAAAAAVGGIPLTQLPLIPPDSWTTRLAGTVLAGQPVQNLTFAQVLALAPQAVDGTFPGKPALTMRSIDVRNSILATVPVAAVAFGPVHLTDLPIPGPQARSTSERWCDAYHAAGIATCPDMTTQTVMSAALQGVPLAAVGVESVPVAAVDLSSSPVAAVPVAAVRIKGTPVAAVPVAAVAVAGSPVAAVPVAAVVLKSAPVAAVPVAAVPVAAVDCSKIACGAATTIGEAAAKGALSPTLTLFDIRDALTNVTLGDIADYLKDTQMTIGQLAPYLPVTITVRDLLLMLMPIASWNWEGADLGALDIQDHATAGGVVQETATFTIGGAGGTASADIRVTLPPGARYKKGSAALTGPGAMAPPEPEKGAGNVLTWHLSGLTFGSEYRLSFAQRPGLTLIHEAASAALDSNGLTAPKSSNAADVLVTDASLEPNDTPAAATPIRPDTLNLGYITSASDVDYYTYTPAVPGARLIVRLSHQQFDGDLVLYGPEQQQLRSSPVAAVPVAAVQVGDQGTGPSSVTATQAPQNLADAPRANLPLLGASLNRGTDDEQVLAVTSGGGPITIQVSGFNGASSRQPYVVRVQEIAPPSLPACPAPTPRSGGTAGTLPALSTYNGAKVLFLVNEKRIGDFYGAAAETSVVDAIQSRITKGDFNTIGFPAAIVPLDGSPSVQSAYDAWDQNQCSPDAANAVVTQIGGLIDRLRAADSALRYLVLVGSDPLLPMGRLVDYTTLSNESDFAGTFTTNNEYLGALGNGYMLSDAVYGSGQPQPYFNRQLYLPDLAVGRLVETPQEIVDQINVFFGSNGTIDPATAGTLNPTSSTTSGYDFLTDGATAVADQLQANIGSAQRLISETWARNDALAQIFPPAGISPGIVSLNAHYDQSRALPAIGNETHATTDLLSTADFAGRTAPDGTPALRRRILFTMGCHAGYSVAGAVVPPGLDADWPQTLAAQQAVYLANTTYGLGDTAAVAYSEQVMTNFAHYLNGSMTVGEAYANAISDYFALGMISPYDEKAGEAATLYGLPMYRFQTGRAAAPPPPLVQTQTDAVTGLTSASLTSTPSFVFHHSATGDYYTDGANPPQTTLYQPLEPRSAPVDVTQPGVEAHGVRIDALQLARKEAITPHYDRPTVDLGANEPSFIPQDASFPDNLSALTTVNTIEGRRQRVVFLQGAFEGNPAAGGGGAGTQSLFSRIGVTVLYSSGTDWVAPAISRVDSHVAGGTVSFTVSAGDTGPASSNPAPGIAAVQVMYRDGTSSTYTLLRLALSNGVWTGTGPASTPTVEFFVQATDLSGNTSITRNKAQNYSAAPARTGSSSTIAVQVNGVTPTAAVFYDASPVVVSASTSTSGHLTYSVDGGPVTDYTGAIPVRGDGFHTVQLADGTSNATVEFGIDTSPPSALIATPHDNAILFIGDTYTADYSCADAGAGVASCAGTLPAGAKIPTLRLPGTYSFTVTATDTFGRTAVVTSRYTLVPGIAFLPPLLGGRVLNIVAKAGSTLPVRFSLLSNQGLDVFDPGYPRSQQVACPTGLIQHPVELEGTTPVGVKYDARTTLYTYGFRTDPTWAGTCRELTVKFRHGSVRKIQLRFR